MGAFLARPVAAAIQAIVSTELTRHRVVESEFTSDDSVEGRVVTRVKGWSEKMRGCLAD
jgi:hypothetical protein